MLQFLFGAGVGAGVMHLLMRKPQLGGLSQVIVTGPDSAQKGQDRAIKKEVATANKMIEKMVLEPVVDDAGVFAVAPLTRLKTARGYAFQDLDRAVRVALQEANGWIPMVILQTFTSRDWRICQDENYSKCLPTRAVGVAMPDGSLLTIAGRTPMQFDPTWGDRAFNVSPR